MQQNSVVRYIQTVVTDGGKRNNEFKSLLDAVPSLAMFVATQILRVKKKPFVAQGCLLVPRRDLLPSL